MFLDRNVVVFEKIVNLRKPTLNIMIPISQNIGKSISIFTAIFFCLSLPITADAKVDFQKISFDEAAKADKKIFVSFSADWCLPCAMMDENIFADEEIASLINENFIAIKADIDTESGNNWNELYNANYLPTSLFARKNGNEIDRLNGVPSRVEFLDFLKRILSEQEIASLDKPAIAHKTKVIKSEIIHAELKEAGKEVVPNDVSKFQIQLGAFGSSNNAQKLIAEVESKNNCKLSVLEEHNASGTLLYKVISQNFHTESEAIEQLISIQRQGYDGFIRKL